MPEWTSRSSSEPAPATKAAARPRRHPLLHPAAKPVLFVLCLLPLAHLVYSIGANTLGPNPAEALIRGTGDWTLGAFRRA